MYHIQEVKIAKLWGYRNLSLRFGEGVNFLVGKNGSGKTAVIQLIAALLAADVDTLSHLAFESISIKLIDQNRLTKQLSAARVPNAKDPTSTRVRIRFGEAEDTESQLPRLYFGPRPPSPLKRSIAESVNLSWLNVDRQRTEKPATRDAKVRTIDEAINGLRASLTRFFSDVKSRIDNEMQEFIKFVFANLIPTFPSEAKLRTAIAPEQDKEALLQVFDNFGIVDPHVRRRLNDFTNRLTSIAGTMRGKNPQEFADKVEMEDFLSVTYSFTTHLIVERWQRVIAAKSEISELQDKFLGIINSVLTGKRLEVNSRNEPILSLPSGHVIGLDDLSSGEKQMFIILGETVLQENKRSIYLADEPELSLHIQWQEMLVSSLIDLNPNAQLIFATHSPDIIGKNRKHVIDMTERDDAA